MQCCSRKLAIARIRGGGGYNFFVKALTFIKGGN